MKRSFLLSLLVALLTAPAFLQAQTLSQAEKDGLLQMRQEEKMAHDVYVALGETYPLPPFMHIPNAEKRHFNLVGLLQDQYELSDPLADRSQEAGYFSDPGYAKLYRQFVDQGAKSEVEALRAGAEIEELDIRDLQQLIAQTENTDLRETYSLLLEGSKRHLRAFTFQLEQRDANYEPKYLSATDFAALLDTGAATGKGTGKCCAKGKKCCKTRK